MTLLSASLPTLTSRSSVRLKRRRYRTTEAPPRPSGRRGRISERRQRPELTTLPLQSRPNASAFWIMLLLSVRALEHGMIEQLKASAVEIVVDLGLFSLAPSEKALGDPGFKQRRAIARNRYKEFF